tara:strand:+ start:1451 stop:2302 length:852 start_codon:yes stop_codon:yes gene_type:complete
MFIKKVKLGKLNFFCISSYNNNLDWLNNYENPHLIYDKTWDGGYKDNDSKLRIPPSHLKEKYPKFNIVRGNYRGYNVTDYLTFIIDNYDSLPDITVFLKGNTIGRHVSEEVFKTLVNNKYFTCIEDWGSYDLKQRSLSNGYAMISCEGGWMEKNTSWYLRHHKHPTKYFLSYNKFLSYTFNNPVFPKYIRFPPGGCFVVPKDYIIKYNKNFYKNLKLFAEHSRVSGEGQLIERALYTIWNCNFDVSEKMQSPFDEKSFTFPPHKLRIFYNFLSKFKSIINKST